MSRVLIVDDVAAYRTMLASALSEAGHVVREACDGDEALQTMEGFAPDLVITDLIMPDKEGLETIIELKRLYPQVRIIAMTGSCHGREAIYLELARKFGAECVLIKPFGLQLLIDALGAGATAA